MCKAAPKTADLKITADNYEGEDIEYNTAQRKLHEVNDIQIAAAVKSLELFIPFFEEWKDMNPRLVVDWQVNQENRIKHIFVCPYYTDQVLEHFIL